MESQHANVWKARAGTPNFFFSVKVVGFPAQDRRYKLGGSWQKGVYSQKLYWHQLNESWKQLEGVYLVRSIRRSPSMHRPDADLLHAIQRSSVGSHPVSQGRTRVVSSDPFGARGPGRITSGDAGGSSSACHQEAQRCTRRSVKYAFTANCVTYDEAVPLLDQVSEEEAYRTQIRADNAWNRLSGKIKNEWRRSKQQSTELTEDSRTSWNEQFVIHSSRGGAKVMEKLLHAPMGAGQHRADFSKSRAW